MQAELHSGDTAGSAWLPNLWDRAVCILLKNYTHSPTSSEILKASVVSSQLDIIVRQRNAGVTYVINAYSVTWLLLTSHRPPANYPQTKRWGQRAAHLRTVSTGWYNPMRTVRLSCPMFALGLPNQQRQQFHTGKEALASWEAQKAARSGSAYQKHKCTGFILQTDESMDGYSHSAQATSVPLFLWSGYRGGRTDHFTRLEA